MARLLWLRNRTKAQMKAEIMARLSKSRDGTKARSKNTIVARLLWLRNRTKAQMKAETMAQLLKSRDGTKERSKNNGGTEEGTNFTGERQIEWRELRARVN